MFISPIIERELRVALRRHKAVKSRLQVAVIGGAIVVLFLFFGLIDSTGKSGRELHSWLFYLGLFMAVVPPATISVGLFSEERRNQTLELLYLAGMGPGEMFGGKLLGGALAASCNLLALAPFLAMPFLCGGISLDLFLATIACFPALLLFTISVGVLASVLCKDDGSALICAIVIGGILSLATPIPYWMGKLLAGAPPFSANWLSLSPAFAPYLVANYFGTSKPRVFWLALAAMMAWAALFLGIAALRLRRTWRKELERSSATGPGAKLEALIYGNASWRTGLRRWRLTINPFQWLVEQDRRPAAMAWAIVGCVCLVWLLGWCLWPRVWPSIPNFYLTAMLLILSVELVMIYTGARRIGNDRRDGVLELLLTTPLMPEQIVDGQYAAMKKMFRPVRAAVFLLCVVMMWTGYAMRVWTTPALVSYGLIWLVLFCWCLRSTRRSMPLAMWIGVNSGRPAFAVFRRQNLWWWMAMSFNLRNFTRAFRGSALGFPTGSGEELVFVCFIAPAVIIAFLLGQFWPNTMRDRLIREMRSIAREPLPDPRDPRFKNWNVRERLPRSAYEEMAERVRVYPQRVTDAERMRQAD